MKIETNVSKDTFFIDFNLVVIIRYGYVIIAEELIGK